MSSEKLRAVAGIVGMVAALGQLPAHAALDLNTGEGALIYAKETLTDTVTSGGRTYYRLNSGNTQRLWLEARVGRAVAAGDTIFVQFSLTDMVFAGATTPTLAVTGKAGAAVVQVSGGAGGDATVGFDVTAGDGEPLAADDMMRLTVTSLGVLADQVGMASVGTSATAGGPVEPGTVTSPVAAHTVASSLRETVVPSSPVVRLVDGFRTFGEKLAASVGRIFVGPSEGPDERTIFSAATSSPVTLGGMISPTASESTVTFRGDVSFTEDVFLSNAADCSTKDEEGILDGSGNWTAVNLAAANNRHLCLEVDGVTSIPETTAYEADIDYTGVTDAVFPPADVVGLKLGKVVRGGVTVRIPFVQTHVSSLYRIIITNRGSERADYRFEFIPPVGQTVIRGRLAQGAIPAASTLILEARDSLLEVVPGSEPGQRRTTATAVLTVEAPPEMIDILTQQLSSGGFSTDTTRYTQ